MEVTFTYNVEITEVDNSITQKDLEYMISTKDAFRQSTARYIKRKLNADNVNCTDIKIFVTGEGEVK